MKQLLNWAQTKENENDVLIPKSAFRVGLGRLHLRMQKSRCALTLFLILGICTTAQADGWIQLNNITD